MNIEAYNLDTLRRIVRSLFSENRKLKERLRDAGIAFSEENPFEMRVEDNAEYDLDQGSRIVSRYITEEMVRKYFTIFWGRQDVYAQRGRNGGYFPQCEQRWNRDVCPKMQGNKTFCDDCEFREWTPLSPKVILKHLLGYTQFLHSGFPHKTSGGELPRRRWTWVLRPAHNFNYILLRGRDKCKHC